MASQSTALRALIAAIPHVGRSIDAVVSQRVTKAEECRLQFMFAELHRAMRGLDESCVRSDVLETKEWADGVKHAVALAARTSDCQRLSAIARVLAAKATATVPSPDPVQVADARHEDVLLARFA